jgi:hypothetical protein
MPAPLRSRTRIVGAVAVLLALVAAACGGDATDPSAPTTTVTTPEGALAEPLTGLPAGGDELATRPAMVVKVDNGPRSLGRQLGLLDADVVFNERVEGGATRLAAVFHSAGPVAVGPVRSARTSDLALISNLNHPIFVFSGANGAVLRMVDDADVEDIYYDRTPRLFTERGSGDLRLVAETDTFYAEASDLTGTPPPLFTYRAEDDPPVEGEEIGGVTVDYGGPVSTDVGYAPDDDGWARRQGGVPHVDADGNQITATNVIIQFIEYVDSGFVDTTGVASPEARLLGSGDAWILTGGRLVEGRWSRQRADAVTLFTDARGRSVDLEPGRTWVELAPVDSGTIESGPTG